jgi:aminoglycoside phosphotransferase (APT) family kinase protein
MNNTPATFADQIAGQLSPLLGLKVSRVEYAHQEGCSLGTVIKVSVFDKDKRGQPLILKQQDNDVAYRLYKQYLVPYRLNSPKEYGYIKLESQRYLVMDYIEHLPTRWEDRTSHLRAVKWLIKKDLITQQNMDSVRNLDCLGIMPYSGLDYWLPEFEKWSKESASNSRAREVWVSVATNQNRINEYIDKLNEEGVQTVVHGDLALHNILCRDDEADDELFVIDWTQPHIGSVTQDLVDLYDSAPDNVKSEIIETYRKQIDFHQFDEIFTKAKVMRDVGYLSWMAWMINVGQKEEIDPKELDRVAKSLILSLGNG